MIKQLIKVAVAEKAAALRTEDYFRQRAARSDLVEFDLVLAKAGAEPARPDDQLSGCDSGNERG
jgi:hypothetical protein